MDSRVKANSTDEDVSECSVEPVQTTPEISSNSCRCFGSLKEVLENVTIEPMLFLKMAAEGLFRVVGDTLEIDRICRVNTNHTLEECQSMDQGNMTELQVEVQIYQNNFNYHQSLMDSFIPLAVVLFLGPLSDRYGRQPAMLSVLIGFILFGFVYILVAINPDWPVEVLYIATFFADIGGTWVVFNMAVYSYISDITSADSRTKRMGIADAIWYMGYPTGTLVGGWMYHWYGYVAVYGTACALWAVCCVYVLVYVRKCPESSLIKEEIDSSSLGCLAYLTSFFKTLCKARPGYNRTLIFFIISVKLGTSLAQGHQMYLWARRVLQWSPTKYSTWNSFDEASHQIGMVAWVWLAQVNMLHDLTVAVGGLVSIAVWSAILASIVSSHLWWLTILASIGGLLEASIEPALRASLTMLVCPGEEGRVLSALGFLEAVWLAVDKLIYTMLYNRNVETFPQINFVVQASIAVGLALCVLLVKMNWLKRDSIQVTNTL